MDKNMINIDDLVRQRLGGGEERERPGSWMQMREMLDQKMPVAPPTGGHNWRRTLGLMTGVALLSALTLGGYQIASTRFADNGNEAEKAAPKGTLPGYTANGNKHIAANDVPGKSASENEVNVHSANTSNETTENSIATTTTRTHRTVNQQLSRRNSEAPDATASMKRSSSPDKNQELNSPTNPDMKPAGLTGALTGTKSTSRPEEPKANRGTEVNNPVADPKTLNGEKETLATTSAQTAEEQPGKDLIAKNNIEPANTFNASVPDNTSTARIKTPAPLEPALPKDSFRKMTIVQRSVINPIAKTRTLITDTISVERFALERTLALSNSETAPMPETAGAENTTAPIMPAAGVSLAAAKADAAISQEFVALSTLKVSSRKTSRWDAQRFQDRVRDVKFSLSQIKFYPGISAGGSYMSGSNNLNGVQFGLFGLVTFGDQWSVMTEGKYVHRFSNGSIVNDDYVTTKQSPTGQLQGDVRHFFKFSTIQSIEMPIALRYAAGRLNIFGGVNLSYNFRVNAEEIDLPAPDNSFTPVPPGPTNFRFGPTISYNDFKSRFGLGGLLGVAYELSPAIQLDLRATRNFWDNASGEGAQKVSRQLYRAPSYQFSIFYRFSQKNQIPKAK